LILVSLYVSETNLIIRSLLQRITEQIACVSAWPLGSSATRRHSTWRHSIWGWTTRSHTAWRHTTWHVVVWRHVVVWWHSTWPSWSDIRIVVRIEVLRWNVVVRWHVGVAVVLRIVHRSSCVGVHIWVLVRIHAHVLVVLLLLWLGVVLPLHGIFPKLFGKLSIVYRCSGDAKIISW